MKRSIGIKPAILPTPALLIGTYDSSGKPNAMTAAWGGICSSNPVSIAFSVQKIRHSFEALLKNKECTINIPSSRIAAETDFFGVRSGKDTDKFALTGLTPVKGSQVHAPYIEECPIIIECRITQILEIGVHTQFIAEVLEVMVDETLINEEEKIDIIKADPFFYDPLNRAYHEIGKFLMPAFTAGSLFPKTE